MFLVLGKTEYLLLVGSVIVKKTLSVEVILFCPFKAGDFTDKNWNLVYGNS